MTGSGVLKINVVLAGYCTPQQTAAKRRNLAVAVRSGEGPFTTRFADLRHRAVKSVVC